MSKYNDQFKPVMQKALDYVNNTEIDTAADGEALHEIIIEMRKLLQPMFQELYIKEFKDSNPFREGDVVLYKNKEYTIHSFNMDYNGVEAHLVANDGSGRIRTIHTKNLKKV